MALRYIFAGCMLWMAGTCWAEPVQVLGVRVWNAPDNTRVVFDVSGPVAHELFTLSGPDRVVIDLRDARFKSSAAKPVSEGRIRALRSAVRNDKDLRLVLDLANKGRPRSFLLKPNGEYGHRLVVDIYDANTPKKANNQQPVKTLAAAPQARELVVAIDAGHGGEDPGARGRNGTREKDVVLEIARKLAALVDKEPGMRAYLVRDGDYFIRLRDRMKKAREQRADLFVSIHADAFRDQRAHGSSVYVLSERGATSEMARLLADQENESDLVGGVSLNDKDDLLKTVLLDLSQAASIEASMSVGDNVLGELKKIGQVHKHRVQQAGFMVLKSPDVPSILVETAFISNPAEERKLRDAHHQQRLAQAVMTGIRNYFRTNPPPGTVMASNREHIIQRGDTLSEIARRYAVSMQRLRVANGLTDDHIEIGAVLRIPEDS